MPSGWPGCAPRLVMAQLVAADCFGGQWLGR